VNNTVEKDSKSVFEFTAADQVLVKVLVKHLPKGVAKEVVAWPRYGLLSSICQTHLGDRPYHS
jgi:hypothetical protein